jgi:organic hydroperoxide reductase OsmC/OhrA
VAGPRLKSLRYAVEVARDGALSIPGGPVFRPPGEWTPDHLLLAALVRCSIASLRHHARHAGHELRASGAAEGTIAPRAEDGRYAFSAIDVRIQAAFDPPADDPDELFARAERDCFVGASLRIEPTYIWRAL